MLRGGSLAYGDTGVCAGIAVALTLLAWRAGWLAGGGRRAQCSDRRGRERQRTEAEGAKRSPEVAARTVDQPGWAVCWGLRAAR